MINELEKYPAYKDSGVPWLGKVPEHWGVQSLGSLTTTIAQRDRPDLPLLSVVREKGVIPRSTMSDEENHNFVPDDLSNYKVVRTGNLVINKMKAWQGSLGIAPIDGVVSPAYFVYDFRIGNRQFGQSLLRSKPYVAFFAQVSEGVRIGQWDLSVHGMKRIPVVVPPLPEQSSIVRFLDQADRRIKRCILAKQKMIKLLEEQKQAIIHQAVTRGLDPNVRLKPSGVEWLGDVPEHWEIKPLKVWTRVNAKTLGENTDPDFSFRYIDISIIKTGLLVEEPTLMIFKNAPSRARRILNEGDTIISTVRTYLKAIWFVDRVAKDLIASTGFAVLSPKHDVEPEYLSYVIQGKNFVDRVTANSTGIAYPAIAETVLGRFKVALPPDRKEQKRLIEWIKENSKPANLMIERIQREISLLREYRTRLIADVVTGKLDVREAAKNLPEDINESETVEEVDVSAEGDSGDEEHETEPTEVEA